MISRIAAERSMDWIMRGALVMDFFRSGRPEFTIDEYLDIPRSRTLTAQNPASVKRLVVA
ncbi:hypothetical protein GRO01_21080 [Gluconobacter roseus NBRC 3990]|uniref:Uncharacterized protein n=1 Tax=Gluconobacter roseus NBRC 3990 TaxID=1307950 RepID=A0A4Y3M5E4_9PROT|nr:hypothetical protein AA3990_1804 [Gluconobacter roseus NBRC 3990]GEB04532.1 hypothetical protein GRO01_21080 [Gluconobacter roseus NBRC 3990]GLP92332.1 hypothetical protein GCM10007871_03100 [Gluconobacter roseus NBRC 3990]